MNLDLTNRRLLTALEENSRLSLTELAKLVHLSCEAVNYRLKQLQQQGIIKKFLPIVNFMKLGYTNYAVYLKLHNFSPTEEKQLITELKNNPSVFWFASTGGNYDLIIELLCSNILDFNVQYTSLMNLCHKYIAKSEVVIRLQQTKMTRNYLLPQQKNVPSPKKLSTFKPLDQLDQQILLLLSENARISHIELSNKLKIPSSTIASRIKSLENNNIIEKYTIFIDPKIYGYQPFKTLISLKDFSPEKINKFFSFCIHSQNIHYFVRCLGKWHIEIESDTLNLKEYQTSINELKQLFPDLIDDIEFIALFEEHKYTTFTSKMLDIELRP